jgi:hypothetical protein
MRRPLILATCALALVAGGAPQPIAGTWGRIRNAFTAARAAAGLSGCTGRAASSGDWKMMEQPPMMHGRRHSAMAGVAIIPTRAATKRLRLSAPA